jgi:LPXTG cell wall anchor motif
VKLRRTTRRVLSALAAVAAGVVGVFVVASPASAHHSAIVGEADCDTATGEWKVTWTVTGYAPSGVAEWWIKEEQATHQTGGSTVTDPNPIPTGEANAKPRTQTFTGTQTVPGDASSAKLKVKAEWSNGFDEDNWQIYTVNFTDVCEQNKPSPTASFSSNCDGTVNVTLRNDDGTADAVFQINGGADIPVAPNAKPDPIKVEAVDGKVTVTSGGEPVGEPYAWTAPEDCTPVEISSKSDCTTLTIELTNPAGGRAIAYKVVVGSDEKTGSLAVGETKQVGPFAASQGTTATVTIGDGQPTTVAWQRDAAACATPTSTQPALPNTGTSGLPGIIAAGVALVLAGAGLLTMLYLRRRRTA